MTTMPDHIKRDLALLQREPRVGYYWRQRPLLRVARYFIRQRAEDAALDAMTRHRSALKAAKTEFVSYRRARKFQDQRMRGQRLGRGPMWDSPR